MNFLRHFGKNKSFFVWNSCCLWNIRNTLPYWIKSKKSCHTLRGLSIQDLFLPNFNKFFLFVWFCTSTTFSISSIFEKVILFLVYVCWLCRYGLFTLAQAEDLSTETKLLCFYFIPMSVWKKMEEGSLSLHLLN